MASSNINEIGLVAREPGGPSGKVAAEVAQWLHERGRKVRAPQDQADRLSVDAAPSIAEMAGSSDLILVFGGDGTLISTAREVARSGCPLLGINLGRLGFLVELSRNRMYPLLEEILGGKMRIEERSMLDVAVLRNKQPIHELIALNDAVVDKGSIARLLRFDVRIDRKHLTDYAADGLIVATPTGSTGYSMAAGGPLLHPSMAAFVLTPICPHMLSTRPIVIPDDSEVAVKLIHRSAEATLTIDGQIAFTMEKDDVVRIRKSTYSTRLVRVPGRTYYEVLRTKLHWNRTTG